MIKLLDMIQTSVIQTVRFYYSKQHSRWSQCGLGYFSQRVCLLLALLKWTSPFTKALYRVFFVYSQANYSVLQLSLFGRSFTLTDSCSKSSVQLVSLCLDLV